MSVSGLALMLDEETNIFVMMELDVRIHGEGWDDTMPSLPVQVVRVQHREIGIRFLDNCDDFWMPQNDADYTLGMQDNDFIEEIEGYHARI